MTSSFLKAKKMAKKKELLSGETRKGDIKRKKKGALGGSAESWASGHLSF